jgi:2-hydroxy-3-oxopropionate reductase
MGDIARGGDDRAKRIGFIGLGVMGQPMARNLLSAGYSLVVHNRSRRAVDELASDGAMPVSSPAEVAANAGIVITMLPDTPDLENVAFGPTGLVQSLQSGDLMVDMSTVDPLATRALGAEFQARGVGFLDAPVSGGEAGARDGTLSIMVGGSEADYLRAEPLFRVLGERIVHIGAIGAGQIAKAANQLVVGVTIEAVAEALSLVEAAGVDPVKVRQALLGGFAASRILEVHGQRMLDRAFAPGFRASLHLKDARIIAHTADEVGVHVPALSVALDAFRSLTDSGNGDLDHSALFLLRSRAETSQEG